MNEAWQLVTHRLRWQLCRALVDGKPVPLPELAKRVGAPAERLRHHLGILEELGVVRSDVVLEDVQSSHYRWHEKKMAVRRYVLERARFLELLERLIREFMGVRYEITSGAKADKQD